MPCIKDFLLTPELTEELLLQLEGAPDSLLESYGKEWLKGGYTRAPAIRNRLMNMARSGARLDDWVVGMLSEHLPFRGFIGLFDASFVRKHFDSLEGLIGRELFVLCLLLDNRPEVFRLGVEEAGRPGARELDYEVARVRLADALAPILIPLVPAPEDLDLDEEPDEVPEENQLPSAAKAPFGTNRERDLEFLLKDAELEIERLQDESEERKARNRRNMEILVKANKRKLHQLQQQRDQFANQARRLETEKATLEKQLHDLRQSQSQAIREGVRQQTDLLLHKWLEPPVRTENILEQTATTTPDLLARAAAALKAQANQDRHTGNRVELTERVAKLLAARNELAQALETAIRPLPENARVLRDLDEEISHIRGILGEASADPAFTRLQERIAVAADPEQLDACSELLDSLEPHGLFPSTDFRKLYSAIQSRYSLYADKAQPRPAPTASSRPSGWLLRDVLYRNTESLLLIDGYNFLFMLPDLFKQDFDHGSPGPRARARMVEAMKSLVLHRPKVQTRIFFDGPSARTDHIAPHLQVEFTGGLGEHRADQLILAALNPRGLSDLGQKQFVVTDDRNLRRESGARGAVYVPVNLFAVLLHDFKAL